MRRAKPERRPIFGDIRYQSTMVQAFINRLMRRGKKSTATTLVYQAFEMIRARA